MKAHLYPPLAPSPVRWRSAFTAYSVFGFILLFGYAAFSKLITFDMFSQQLAQSPFIGAYSGLLSGLIPALELLICLLLTLPVSRLAGLLAFTLVMTGFTGYIGIMLAFSTQVPCICGGVISGLSWGGHLAFNSVFLLWAVVLLLFFKKELHP